MVGGHDPPKSNGTATIAAITPAALAELSPAEGGGIRVAVKAAETHVYPA